MEDALIKLLSQILVVVGVLFLLWFRSWLRKKGSE